MNIDLRCGDSLEVLKSFEDNTFSSVVCDPPYGLSFMGKKWDYDVPTKELWAEVLRVLKTGRYSSFLRRNSHTTPYGCEH